MADYNDLLELEIEADRAFAIAQGEPECREQAAQPTAIRANIAASMGLTSVANHIDPNGTARIAKLAAENERLRAALRSMAVGIREVADLLAPTAPATADALRRRADEAIEAAKGSE